MKHAPPPPPPEVPCPCGTTAPRVAIGCGVDLHHCACGRWLHRWWCCGAVSERGDDAGYRMDGDCPGCGESRWREGEVRPVLTGGVVMGGMAQEVLETDGPMSDDE